MKRKGLFDLAERDPIKAFLLFGALLAFWTYFAFGDLLDGVVDLKGGRSARLEEDPVQFWLTAAMICAVELFAVLQISVAFSNLVGTKSK